MLRVMVPGVKRAFFRTRMACHGYTLDSLADNTKRRELVHHMPNATNLISGSIGERREMRQDISAICGEVAQCIKSQMEELLTRQQDMEKRLIGARPEREDERRSCECGSQQRWASP